MIGSKELQNPKILLSLQSSSAAVRSLGSIWAKRPTSTERDLSL